MQLSPTDYMVDDIKAMIARGRSDGEPVRFLAISTNRPGVDWAETRRRIAEEFPHFTFVVEQFK